MAKFEINQAGIDKFTASVQTKLNEAIIRGEQRAEGQGPEQMAESVAQELESVGFKPDRDALLTKYREALTEGS